MAANGRRRLLLFALISALVLPAAARASDPPWIVPGRSIGAVRIGMSKDELIRVYGQPRSVKWYRYGVGVPRVRVASYTLHHGAFWVTYDGDVVVGVGTASRYYRTRSGVGPGSSAAAADALPGVRWDECTGTYHRSVRGVDVFFTPVGQRKGAMIRTVSMLKQGYESC